MKMIFLATSVFLSPLTADAAKVDRHAVSRTNAQEASLEQAEIAQSKDGRYVAYLTIWNGTSRDKFIKNIAIGGFRNLALGRMAKGVMSHNSIGSRLVYVPSKSELHMDLDTVFVLMERGGDADPVVTVSFDDDTTIQMGAQTLAPGQSITDHRHAFP
jgi:hypothetical protein